MSRMNNQLKTVALLGILSALLVGIGSLLGPGFVYAFAALALIMNVGAYFFSDRLVLRMHGARELAATESPRLHAIVQELAAHAGIPTPRLFLISDPSPNAFATGRNPENGVVAVTEGILQLLSERELRGVLAHELAHIKNRDILVSTIAAVLASTIGSLAHALSFLPFFHSSSDEDDGASPLQGILFAVLAPIAATLIQLGVSRSREYLADATGAAICSDPLALAGALAKLEHGREAIPMAQAETATASLFIVNPLLGGGMTRWFSTHPATEERIRRLHELASGQRLTLAA